MLFSLFCDNFDISMFSHILHSFFKNWIIHFFEKSFSKPFFASFLWSVFRPMYGFNHASWLNWITLCTFFYISLWFSACFKFLMHITYSVLLSKLVTSFLNFSSFFLSGKNDKSTWSWYNFSGYWNSRKYPSSLSSKL